MSQCSTQPLEPQTKIAMQSNVSSAYFPPKKKRKWHHHILGFYVLTSWRIYVTYPSGERKKKYRKHLVNGGKGGSWLFPAGLRCDCPWLGSAMFHGSSVVFSAKHCPSRKVFVLFLCDAFSSKMTAGASPFQLFLSVATTTNWFACFVWHGLLHRGQGGHREEPLPLHFWFDSGPQVYLWRKLTETLQCHWMLNR